MPRYGDAWVVDRTLYNHINNGAGASCLCCGSIGNDKNNKKSNGPFPFDPEGWRGMLNVLVDWTVEEVGIDFQDNVSNDNDTKTKISSYSKKWKWPSCDIRDEIWLDRIRLRRNMMKDVEMYRTFTMEVFMKIISNGTGIGIPSLQDKQPQNKLPQYQQQQQQQQQQKQLQLQSTSTLKKYCIETIGIESLQKDIFYPIRRNDVFNNIIIVPVERKQTQTDGTLINSNKGVIKSKALYNIILDSCLTQVAMFHLTRYGLDGRREVQGFDNDDNIGNDRNQNKLEGEEEEWWGEIGFEHLLSYKGDTYGGLGSSGGGEGSDGWFVLDVANNYSDACDNDHHDIDNDSSSDEESCEAFDKHVNIMQQSSQQQEQEQEQEWQLSNDGKNLDTFLSILVCGWLNSNVNYYNDDDPIQLFPKASSNCKAKGGIVQQQQEQQKQNERLIVGPNFRGDRRVVRLLLARIWAGRFIERWRNDHS